MTLLLFGAVLGPPGESRAHSVDLNRIEVTFASAGTYVIELRIDLWSLMAGRQPGHLSEPAWQHLVTMETRTWEARQRKIRRFFHERTALLFDGERRFPNIQFVEFSQPTSASPMPATDRARVRVRLTGNIPDGADRFQWAVDPGLGHSALLIYRPGRPPQLEIVAPGELSRQIPLKISRIRVFARYVQQGFVHILPAGLDHILFVLGLFLLTIQLRPLLWQISAFTIAHTVTLGLAAAGIVNLPAAVVEPLIAASIVWIGVENLFLGRMRTWRPLIVFVFGLLHGLGFAGVLGDLGIPEDHFLTALLGFNIGVEAGQLSVILLALAALGWTRTKDWYGNRVRRPLSLLIALIALFWTVERLLS